MKKALFFLLAVVILLPSIIYFGMGRNSSTDSTEPNTAQTEQISNTANMNTDLVITHTAVISTTLGDITVDLYGEETPETVKNFVTLAQEGKYQEVPFHRVIEGFMIQTGDFQNQNGTGGHSYKGPGTNIPDEFSPKLTHVKGALSMANAGPNTGGSQFFIVHAPETDWLNGGHSVFGQAHEESFPVIDAIATTETGFQDQPVTPILINSITITEK